MIPFHSPFSFFLPKVWSFTNSISKVKFKRSAKSNKISMQKPTNSCVEFESFEPRMIANRSATSTGHRCSYSVWHTVVPRQRKVVNSWMRILHVDLRWLWLFLMFDFGFLAFWFRSLWRNSAESPIGWEDLLTSVHSNRWKRALPPPIELHTLLCVHRQQLDRPLRARHRCASHSRRI